MRAAPNKKPRTSWRPFEEARKYVHGLKLRDREAWSEHCKSGKKPKDIPASPSKTYKHEWKNWGDWLGTFTIAVINREFRPFEEAKKYAQGLKLKSKEAWSEHCKSGKKPDEIPADPVEVYKNKGWKNWGDWLGTYIIATGSRIYRPFEETKEFIRGKFKGKEEYDKWVYSKDRPKDIPSHPARIYKKEWKGWPNFLGYEETDWSIRKVKELLRGWI